jgi:hypothetical protein
MAEGLNDIITAGVLWPNDRYGNSREGEESMKHRPKWHPLAVVKVNLDVSFSTALVALPFLIFFFLPLSLFVFTRSASCQNLLFYTRPIRLFFAPSLSHQSSP